MRVAGIMGAPIDAPTSPMGQICGRCTVPRGVTNPLAAAPADVVVDGPKSRQNRA